jgi:diguanylate cyclase (GGDEF)-like protein/PAS domain S-box-containing protein
MPKKQSPLYLPTLDQVIDRSPLTVGPDTLLTDVITLMGENRATCLLSNTSEEYYALSQPLPPDPLESIPNSSYVLIVESGLLKGIFTERDMVRLIAASWDFRLIKIKEVMSHPVMTLTETAAQDVFTVLIILRQHHIRHLPILNEKGELLGVITPDSIRNAMLQPTRLLRLRKVTEVMTRNVIQAPPTISVLGLAQLMSKHGVSCVVITEEKKEKCPESRHSKTAPLIPIGIVTERDIVQFKVLELNLSQLQASTVMSYPLASINAQESLWVAHRVMQERYVRRLVVINEGGELLGIITQTSLLSVLDPIEMSGIIDALHGAVEEQTAELKQANIDLINTNNKLKQEITIRQRAESRLRLLESCVVSANDAIVIMEGISRDVNDTSFDPEDPRIFYVNEAFTKMTGYLPEEIIGKNPSYLRGIDTDPLQVAQIKASFQRENPLRVELINYRKDGTPYWVELNSVPVKDEEGKLSHWISIQRNITERKFMEKALFEEKELAQVTLKSIGDGVITTDSEGRVVSLNPVAETLTGWSTVNAKGLPLTKVMQIIHEATGTPMENTAKIAMTENRIVDMTDYSVLIARNNHEFAIDHCASPIHTNDGRIIGAVVVFRDVTQIRIQAHQLSWQATHDALTGLVNRREFEYQLQQAVQNAQKHNQQHLLLYLDLDRFKIVNDTCGHVAGDELLRQVSELFKQRIRKTDMLARLGGDEFAILLYQCPLNQGLQVSESLLHSIQSFRFVWEDKTFTIGVSIGLAVIDPHTLSHSSVLSCADVACYAAKDKGRNRVQIYQVGDRELAKQKGEAHWAVRINQALENNHFALYSQSIFPLKNPSKCDHYEILLRMDDGGKPVSPMAFMPAAERYNLMHSIDRWVIETLFANLKETTGLYAINLSGSSINDEQFIDFLTLQFSTYQIPPQLICFEITETIAISNLSKAATFIRQLKDLGCQFALDDFGCGMSSFSYLKNLPVDFVKIDGNFVKSIVDSPVDFAMVEAINRIGHVMGIKTIAEYVENEIILTKLQEMEVDYGQGFYLDKPQPFITLNSPKEIVSEINSDFFTIKQAEVSTKIA